MNAEQIKCIVTAAGGLCAMILGGYEVVAGIVGYRSISKSLKFIKA